MIITITIKIIKVIIFEKKIIKYSLLTGHFLLTNLLLDDLKKTAGDDGEARVVVVSSGLHDPESSKKWMKSKRFLLFF